jgi:hypothetical protein
MFTAGGREDVAVFLRPGANSEGDSQFSRDRGLKLIKSVPEIEVGPNGPARVDGGLPRRAARSRRAAA